jgi:hypothetical protein
MTSKNSNRFSRRKIARSNALFQVKSEENELLNKKQLSSTQFEDFVEFIRKNQNGKFGIAKLKDYNLNIASKKYGKKTLLDIAVFYGRDVIESLLLRAGASPLPRSLLESADEKDMEFKKRFYHFRWNSNSYFYPYIVKLCLGNREENELSKPCITCHAIPNSGLIKLIPCLHNLCDFCFWDAVLKRCNKNDDIACPECCTILAVNEDEFKIYPLEINQDDLDHLEPEKISLESRQKWASLPDKFIPTAVAHKTKNVFTAMPMRAISRLYLGESKTGRTENLFKAVLDGNLIRVKALICAGVDIDVMNDYGQTSLFIGRWKNHHKIAEFLISCGAKVIAENAGHLPDDFLSPKNEFDIKIYQNKKSQFRKVTSLIDPELYPGHPGTEGGSFLLEGFIPDVLLEMIEGTLSKLPLSLQDRKTVECSNRYYYCDSFGILGKYLSLYIQEAGLANAYFFPQMRFLDYPPNGYVPPHVDLARTNSDGLRSTHTFILYLTSSSDHDGGATILLKEIPTKLTPEVTEIARIIPKRSSLLLFPHLTPHEGRPAFSSKILLRGEMVFLENY